MAWLRIDDRVRTHPKIANAGPAAAWLWFCGVCYCREHLTDGYIPKSVVGSLAMNLPSPFRHATKLVEVRLWEDALGGYQVHDFLDWNPSKAEVLANRVSEADRKRTERGVSERTKRGVPLESSHVRAGDAGLGSVLGSGISDLVSESEENPTGDPPPVFRKPEPRNVGLINGAEQRRHQHHGWCSTPIRDGLCVLDFLHREFLGKSRRSEDELKRWYLSVVQAYEGVEVGDDTLVFWRNEFAAWVGTVTVKPTETRESRTLAAARRTATYRGELP